MGITTMGCITQSLKTRKRQHPPIPALISTMPMADLVRMSPDVITAMRMSGTQPTRDNRVQWFLEGMIEHHGGALQMAHEARQNSTNPSILRLAREIIVAQRKEIIELRKMLQSGGLNKPAYYKFDDLFAL